MISADCLATLESWALALADNDIEAITSLYHNDAVLLPTFSSRERASPELIRHYFVNLFKLQSLRVEFNEQFQSLQSLDKSLVVTSGLYTFSHIDKDNLLQTNLSRYTYVIEMGARPLIHLHHSSMLPLDI